MSSPTRRGGIPGPESRTGLTRPSMTEAEFERRLSSQPAGDDPIPPAAGGQDLGGDGAAGEADGGSRGSVATARSRAPRAKPAKPRRVQRMFAIEEEVDKKLWLYAIHMGKDRSEVVNDLLRPVVASMVLYDSRDRRGRNAEVAADRAGDELQN
ncbi:hypothetical protein OJF2_78260 (plasmid) [Aquisphaera giovannonii]|uniref:Uncharacterized protein n=2 Tax=Aquisphaera giovannonii TaxID=406548 RepID=A0A5B9WF50_9BACT|nr:hypothetical protein OJF2_78260 [Aquisphaera giovannonii]